MDKWVRGSAIGKGSFGTVSLAVKSSGGGGCVSAVKSVARNSCLPSQIEALENEIRILRSVSSPYVVAYLGDDETAEGGSGTTSFYRNLHMEYLPGGTAADVARERRRRIDGGGEGAFGVEDERSVGNHAFCVASALKYLHAQGIVHCDVKGDNVLVGPAAETAKLADFGSAAAETAGWKRISPRGSPMWMAPEVIRGEYQGPESDVWSLGCTVIEMVTGKPPWEDRGAAETICRIGYSDELPPIPADLSETGRDFVEKCLRREIHQRWSCDQLLQHPFISKCTPAAAPPPFSAHLSPRCVLDTFSTEYSDDEEEHRETSTSVANSKLSGNIGKLSSGGGAIWESDGWTTVRELNSNAESAAVSVSGEGTNWEFTESRGAELENDDSIGTGELRIEEYLVNSSPTGVEESVRNYHHDRDENGVVMDFDEPELPSSIRRRRTPFLWSLISLFILYWFHGLYTKTNSKCYQLLYYYCYPSPYYMKLLSQFIMYQNREVV